MKLSTFRLTPLKINFAVIMIALLFNEIVIYYLQRLRWDSIVCETSDCERILLIADPQILGDERERWIYRWDNDRHLEQTYRQAFAHVKPKSILFLGDLMDEGSIADDDKFKKYFKRFMRIFEIPRNIKTFYTPGDNDIGGEWPEPVDKTKVIRFKQYFSSHNSTKLNDKIKVFNINMMTNEVTDYEEDNVTTTNVFMSHYPVVNGPNSASYKISKTVAIKPSVIFSAHDHESVLIVADIPSLRSRYIPLKNLKAFDLEAIKIRHKILEIQVPSCSYRMGTMTIGYAQVMFDNGEMKYSPLFVISRFYQLGFYAILMILMLIVNTCISLRNKRFRVGLKT